MFGTCSWSRISPNGNKNNSQKVFGAMVFPTPAVGFGFGPRKLYASNKHLGVARLFLSWYRVVRVLRETQRTTTIMGSETYARLFLRYPFRGVCVCV